MRLRTLILPLQQIILHRLLLMLIWGYKLHLGLKGERGQIVGGGRVVQVSIADGESLNHPSQVQLMPTVVVAMLTTVLSNQVDARRTSESPHLFLEVAPIRIVPANRKQAGMPIPLYHPQHTPSLIGVNKKIRAHSSLATTG